MFEVRIYPTEYRVKNLLAEAKALDDADASNVSPHAPGLDLSKLRAALTTLDPETIRQRRLLYNRLYHEARLSFEHGKGISFTNMLLMLAHNKLIADKDALRYGIAQREFPRVRLMSLRTTQCQRDLSPSGDY